MKFRELLDRLKFKYNVVVIDEQTLTERFNIHLSWLRLINIIGLLFIIVIALLSLLIFATPIKTYLPGFEGAKIKQAVIEQGARMDSLTREIEMAEQQLYNIKLVIAGEISIDSIPDAADTSIVTRNKALKIDATEREKAFREEVEADKNKEKKKR